MSPTTVVSHAVPIEVQRISSNGVVLWNANGVSVGQMESAYNYDFDFIADGAGGAILAWDAIAANSPAIVASALVPMVTSCGIPMACRSPAGEAIG